MNEAVELQSRLADADPHLYAQYQQSWNIAVNEWLPAMPSKKGSSNAYPHIRNVAGYLQHLVLAFEDDPSSCFEPLSAGEIYIALLSVLFHDFGRMDPESSKPGADENREQVGHGWLSDKHLRKSHAWLGIHDLQVADLVGRIVTCHEPNRKDIYDDAGRFPAVAEAISNLSEETIDSLGTIRSQLIAALLALADQMDGAYTRTIPAYLDHQLGGPIGLFRKHVMGVVVDPANRMIKTILTLESFTQPKDTQTQENLCLRVMGGSIDSPIDQNSGNRFIKNEEDLLCIRESNNVRPKAEINDWLKQIIGIKQCEWPTPFVDRCIKKKLEVLEHFHMAIAQGRIRLETSNKYTENSWKPVQTKMPVFGPQAMAIADMPNNRMMLHHISRFLARYGIQIDAWLISINDQLFFDNGKQSFEPVISKKLMHDVAKSMWRLSTRILDSSSFTFNELASHLGDPNVARVRTACRRIASAAMGHTENRSFSLWTGINQWHWYVLFESGKDKNSNAENALKLVIDRIDALEIPYATR